MVRIENYHTPSENKKGNFLKDLLSFFLSLDKFSKLMIIIFVLIIIVTPAITTQYFDIRQRAVNNDRNPPTSPPESVTISTPSSNLVNETPTATPQTINQEQIVSSRRDIPTLTPTIKPTNVVNPRPRRITPTPTIKPTFPPTNTPTQILIPTFTPSPTPTKTPTPSPTLTFTPTPTHTLTPTPIPSPSDVNRDGCVGIQDFNIWQQAFSTQTVQPSTYPDINKDGAVDILDFNVWYQVMKSGVGVCP